MSRQHMNGPRMKQPRQPIVQCPWSMRTEPGEEHAHPQGAPACAILPDQLEMGRVVLLAELVTWNAMVTTEMAMVVNEMWLTHIVEHGGEEEAAHARALLFGDPEEIEGQMEISDLVVVGEVSDAPDLPNGTTGDQEAGQDLITP